MKNNVISVNAKVVRSVNRAMILNLVREKQPISRIQIARICGLNKSTVSSIVNDLLEEDLIYEKNTQDNNIGRNPINLYLKLGKYFIGAISIDYSITRFAITDLDGSIILETSEYTNSENAEEYIKNSIKTIRTIAEKNGIKKLKGLGVTISGIVDSNKMIVNYASNLGWRNFNIGEILKRECPDIEHIAVGNDAKASAMAELWFGSMAGNLNNFVFLTLGSGIGTGIVVEKQLINGEFNACGEFGHMSIYEKGDKCICGNVDCWEAYASDKATVKRYRERVKINVNKNVDVEVQDIIDLANQGDLPALEVIKETGYFIGLGIINIIKAIDPQAIIIGGRIISCWSHIYPEMLKVIREKAFFFGEKEIKILPTSLVVRPRLLGAATIAIKKIFDDYKIIV